MIETADPDAVPSLVPLLRHLNALHAAHMPERYHDTGSDAALEAILRRDMAAGARFLVYRTEGTPRGYLKWLPGSTPEPALERARRQALLDHICVLPAWRRRGMATRLIARFEADIAVQGYDGWTVRVHAFNAASAALMQRQGAALAVQSYAKPLR